MDRLEEVKRILNRDRDGITVNYNGTCYFKNFPTGVEELAEEICSLFQPKPDESRLLSDEEIEERFKRKTDDGETYEDYARQLGIHLQDAINIARHGAVLQLTHCEPLIRVDERAMTLKEVEDKLVLERCDPDVMQYFNDYYWIDKGDWEALKKGIPK